MLVPVLVAALAGCPGPEPEPDPCADEAHRFDDVPCMIEIADAADWEALSIPAGAIDQISATKYLAPASDDARLPTMYLDAHQWVLHFDFLTDVFGDRFPSLSPVEYVTMILDPDHREFFAGTVTEYLLPDGSRLFGFIVWDDPTLQDGAITQAEVAQAYALIEESFALRPLAWVPASIRQRNNALTWDADFPMHGLQETLEYEAYTVGTGYGTVRFVSLAELPDVIASASIGFQDIVVLEDAPVDIERVISGAVTGARQNDLSHLNIRSAARGTPNCYRKDPFDALAEWEGRLVALTCGEDELTVVEATLEDAEAWWEALRPDPVVVPPPDLAFDALVPLLDVPTDTAEERAAAVARFGGKGSALATLYQRVPSDLQLSGFVVPFAWYDAFMQGNSWVVDDEERTFAATVEGWLADEDFLSDGALRRERLEALRAAMQEATVDPALLDALAGQIEATWGADDVAVRFRSSSNAEDSVAFGGAGLYDSTSACLADERDGDDAGPSRCDSDWGSERTLQDALRQVWASLWNMEAFEERAWYAIDHADVAMGILVNDRSKDEQANIVVFTGAPTGPVDDRFVVNAQEGELSVVSPAPGEVVEKSLLTMEGGAVVEIDRVVASSEVPAGSYVLDDDRLDALGAAMADIEAVYPLDEEPPADGLLLLDSEWKVLVDGRLIVKQVRPFLRAAE